MPASLFFVYLQVPVHSSIPIRKRTRESRYNVGDAGIRVARSLVSFICRHMYTRRSRSGSALEKVGII